MILAVVVVTSLIVLSTFSIKRISDRELVIKTTVVSTTSVEWSYFCFLLIFLLRLALKRGKK